MLTGIEIQLGQLFRELTQVRRFRVAVDNPLNAQTKRLLKIIDKNKDTAFGKEHGFDKIKSIADFQNAVPANTYEDLRPYIEAEFNGQHSQLTSEDPFMFATTSGTTDKPKFIPITREHLRDYTHAFQVYSFQLANDHPDAAAGRYLIISSNDEEGVSPAGIPYGAISGVLNRMQPAIVKRFFALPYEVSKIKDVSAKYYLMLRICMAKSVSAIFCCNPSSLLLLAEMMQQQGGEIINDIFDGTLSQRYAFPEQVLKAVRSNLKPDPETARNLMRILDQNGKLLPQDVWPGLRAVSCWKGGPLGFYLDQLPEYFGDVPIRDFGYMSSEGRGSIPMSDQGAGGVLALTSHFFEFVEENDADHPDKSFLTAEQLALGNRYYIYFTTASGLYRYDIKDLVEVVGFHKRTPVIQFVRKSAGFSSITGEKLTEEQVRVALMRSIRQLNLNCIGHFTTAVEFGHPPRYVCYVELKDHISDALRNKFVALFDTALKNQNCEYQDKRSTLRLGSPVMKVVPPGTRARLVQKRVSDGAPEAQVKIPLLMRYDDMMLSEMIKSL